ncbi:MAG: phosphoenolpyruvate--protein phosphotransferase [Defluviitaleaceae bacterium]|nr:phosphoenolpyruvate--protein phosphotransferase [Defluviitaleaceae bacterium]
MKAYQGRGINNGIAFGAAFILKKAQHHIDDAPAQNPDGEWARFLAAKKEADNQLEALMEKTQRELGQDEAMIIDVQRMMLLDEDFDDAVRGIIYDGGHRAPYATNQAGTHFAAMFAAMDDDYMKARAVDVADLAGRLTQILLGVSTNLHLTAPSIIIAEDLTPSETLQMDKSKIRAFVIQQGSDTSHTAILARIMNIACIIQCDIPLDEAFSGQEMAVDGAAGICYLVADDATRANLLEKQKNDEANKQQLLEMKGLPTITADGRTVRLYSNIGSPDDIPYVLENDAEGIGLFRSEFLYLGRDSFPSEEEQFEAYQKVAQAMGDKQVIIRTLDIGADKQADYFKLDAEENPALGLRGIRICIERPDIFTTQLRAIYRASAFGNIAMMFPMIASVWEVQHCNQIAADVRSQLVNEGHTIGKVEIGIMIETPSAVMMADELAKEVDFFSVGTNDLTQYALAIDRQNNKLDRFYNPHHPAVMRMLGAIATAARNTGISAGICGEMAADTKVTKTLIDMGFDKLSVSPAYTLALRKVIREIG